MLLSIVFIICNFFCPIFVQFYLETFGLWLFLSLEYYLECKILPAY